MEFANLYCVNPVGGSSRRSLNVGQRGIRSMRRDGDVVFVSAESGDLVIPWHNVAWAEEREVPKRLPGFSVKDAEQTTMATATVAPEPQSAPKPRSRRKKPAAR